MSGHHGWSYIRARMMRRHLRLAFRRKVNARFRAGVHEIWLTPAWLALAKRRAYERARRLGFELEVSLDQMDQGEGTKLR